MEPLLGERRRHEDYETVRIGTSMRTVSLVDRPNCHLASKWDAAKLIQRGSSPARQNSPKEPDFVAMQTLTNHPV